MGMPPSSSLDPQLMLHERVGHPHGLAPLIENFAVVLNSEKVFTLDKNTTMPMVF